MSFQYTVEGKVAYAPAVARLECGFFPNDPHGFWQENGYGLLSVFKVDWDRFGGKYESCHSGEENSQLWAVPVGYVPLNKVCFLFVSESRAGYQNHPLSLQEVSFVSTFWLWNQRGWFFPFITSTLESLAIHAIWLALCDLFMNHTIFCAKSHLFLSQKKRNTKTAQQNRFQILLKVTNQISGEMDVIEY